MMQDDSLFDYTYILSDYCHRAVRDIPAGTCFLTLDSCNGTGGGHPAASPWPANFIDRAYRRLGIARGRPGNLSQPHVRSRVTSLWRDAG